MRGTQMLALSWTTPVVVPGDPATARDRLWKAMLRKAEFPVEYVPAITECAILERYADGGFLRRASRGERTLVQRVFPDEAAGRIAFRHEDHTDLAEIYDQIGDDGNGGLTLTLGLRLTPRATERALAESDYLSALNADFDATLADMTGKLIEAAASFEALAVAA
ncbi:DUF1857 family protein [Streptomyces sp. HNM0663]|uniref:DUF1857 family protein n=1 Tax=Streptomyces chengmaiensis TaxID=3040919 RepID=A0ABT6HSD8_9ACTN|nr:AtaL-like protein [Streptomyces chengmaiensis]MDH2390969.1 DUF1857 family protein [Streptomyces chengmaiensis]